MDGIKKALAIALALSLFALGNSAAGKLQIAQDASSIGTFAEQLF